MSAPLQHFTDLGELPVAAVHDLLALARRLESQPEPQALAGRVAVVTGGSRGFGFAIAERLGFSDPSYLPTTIRHSASMKPLYRATSAASLKSCVNTKCRLPSSA